MFVAMSTPWFGRPRRTPQEQSAATAARDGAVAAFLDLDTRQRFIGDAISALKGIDPQSTVLAQWRSAEQKCFQANADYLNVSQQYALEDMAGDPTPVDIQAAAHAFLETHRTLAAAAAATNDFYNKHRRTLDEARTALNAIPRIAEEAVQNALAARASLTGEYAPVAGYSSVRTAAMVMDSATLKLDQALASGSVPAIREAAAAVHTAASQIDEAAALAKTAGDRAALAISSVRTRISAVTTRTERLPQARSNLLREFSAPNSADLTGNVNVASRELEEGERDWEAAVAAQSNGDAERALDLLAQARQHLNEATEACDALTDRLEALKAVKADPAGPERQTRFRIRDTQRLVVDRGLVKEWGSVLDAQSKRVERATDLLGGVHPNYWAYLQELHSVETFVKSIVDRVRQAASAG